MNRTNDFGQAVGAPLKGSLPRPALPRAPMQGRSCTLVPLSVEHAPALFAANSRAPDPRNFTYLPQDPFETEAAYADWAAAVAAGEDPMFFTILDPTGAPMGIASFMRIDRQNGVAEIGNIHFSPLMQGTTAATEGLFLMMDRVLGELGYRRLEWKCDSLNAPSRRAAERLGFTYEGTFRQHMHYKGRNRDTAWFSIIDSDWPTIRDGFTRWLAPENFDANGRQKAPLRR